MAPSNANEIMDPLAEEVIGDGDEVTVPVSDDLIKQLMAMVDDVRSDNKALRAELDRRAPEFRAMKRPTGSGGSLSDVLGRLEKGQEVLGNTTLPIAANGLLLDKSILNVLNPRFQVGDLVRINPDSVRPGSIKPWGEILNGTDPVGEVVKVYYLGRDLQWKYRCRIPTVTSGEGDGFRDNELVAVY